MCHWTLIYLPLIHPLLPSEDYSESGYGTVSNPADTEIISLESHGPRAPHHSAVSHTSVTSKGGVVTETLC